MYVFLTEKYTLGIFTLISNSSCFVFYSASVMVAIYCCCNLMIHKNCMMHHTGMRSWENIASPPFPTVLMHYKMLNLNNVFNSFFFFFSSSFTRSIHLIFIKCWIETSCIFKQHKDEAANAKMPEKQSNWERFWQQTRRQTEARTIGFGKLIW